MSSAQPQADPRPLIEVAVVNGPPQLLTYLAEGELPPLGSRVQVPLGGRRAVGFVVGHPVAAPEGVKRLRAASSPVDPDTAIVPEILALTRRVADYYMVPWGQVLAAALPPRGKGKPSGPRTVRVASLAIGDDAAEAMIAELEARAPRQGEALRRLLAERDTATARLPQGTVPRLLEKGVISVRERVVERVPLADVAAREPATAPAPTPTQAEAVTRVGAGFGGFAPFLLHGVTGSGKTEVYLTLAERAIREGKQALILTPEIALASRLTLGARARFGRRVALLHSGLSDGERFDEWQRVRADDGVDLVVGTRSAVFAPLARLGLIVVDEEHDGAYKQEESPRYHGRDVAVMRAQEAGIPVVLGSATPSLESYTHAKGGQYGYLELPQRVHTRPMPEVTVVDLRTEHSVSPEGLITQPLFQALEQTLDRGEQALLFLNRRGFSPSILCPSCGHTFHCHQCQVSLTFHRHGQVMQCHYCDTREKVPSACSECGAVDLRPLGVGTEGLVEELEKLLPEARVARMDRDSTRGKNAHMAILEAMESREIDILVGTQMIAKGHDLPGVTLVGVVCADQGIHIPDFRAAELAFSLLTQVAGRAGRGETPGRVILQAFDPEQPAILHAVGHDYAAFAVGEMEMRRATRFPPAGRCIRLVFKDASETRLDAACKELERIVAGRVPGEVMLLGPAPAPLALLRGEFRRHLLVTGEKMAPVRQTARWLLERIGAADGPLSKVRVEVDVDPQNLM